MSFSSQYSNEGEIYGWLDVKSELTRERGLLQKIKSPWKKRYCTAFRMVEMGRNGQRFTTIRLDTYPDKQSFSRSSTCQSYGLTAGQIVRIVRCLSSTRRYAFSVFKTVENEDDDCDCPGVEAFLQLAGYSEVETQAWIRFLRDSLFPVGKVPLEGTYDLTIIDNMASREAKLSGNIYLDAQINGIVLLRPEDAQTVAIWPFGAVKKAELVATDIPQDVDKILSIVNMDPRHTGHDQEYHFFSWTPLKELKVKLTNSMFLYKEAISTPRRHNLKSVSMSAFPSNINPHRHSTSSMFSKDDDLQSRHHQCRDNDRFRLDESVEEDCLLTGSNGLSIKYEDIGKKRKDNLSCPLKSRPLPMVPNELRRGSTDDTFYNYERRNKKMETSRLAKQTSTDSGKESIIDGGDDQLSSLRHSVVGSTSNHDQSVSPSLPLISTFDLDSSSDNSRTSRGDSGTQSIGDQNNLEDEVEQPRLSFSRTAESVRSERKKTITLKNSNLTLKSCQFPSEVSLCSTYKGDDDDVFGAPSEQQPQLTSTHLQPPAPAPSVIFGEESSTSGETVVSSRGSPDHTFMEDGEVFNEPKEVNGRKNVEAFLGMNDGSRPHVPPKKSGDANKKEERSFSPKNTTASVKKATQPSPLPRQTKKAKLGQKMSLEAKPKLIRQPSFSPEDLGEREVEKVVNRGDQQNYDIPKNPGCGDLEYAVIRRSSLQNPSIINAANPQRESNVNLMNAQSLSKSWGDSLNKIANHDNFTSFVTTDISAPKNSFGIDTSALRRRVSQFQSPFEKNAALIYDHVGLANLTDELMIIQKQRHFFMRQLHIQGTLSSAPVDALTASLSDLPSTTQDASSVSTSMDVNYDVPRGCKKTRCPCESDEASSHQLSLKMNNESMAPSLPPKKREFLL